jgi:hypothetical protein
MIQEFREEQVNFTCKLKDLCKELSKYDYKDMRNFSLKQKFARKKNQDADDITFDVRFSRVILVNVERKK